MGLLASYCSVRSGTAQTWDCITAEVRRMEPISIIYKSISQLPELV
jgi:hypothetical protein